MNSAIDQKPNIILIILDAGRFDYLSCYGQPGNLTPNIDKLAEKGILFEQATTVAPWTVPSHASMFTGLYPNQHQANWNTLRIKEGIPTIFDILRNNSYKIAAFVANDTLIFPCKIFGDEADVYGFTRHSRKDLSGFVDGFSAEDSNCYRITSFFEDWLSKNTAQPFFLYFNYYDLHSKYDAVEPYRSRYLTHEDKKILDEIGDRFDLHFKEMNREVTVTAKQIQALKNLYKAKMAMVDENVGKVISRLEEKNLLENSIVIITSDHGDNIGDHTYPSFHHQFSIYNALTRIPLIFYSPKFGKSAKRISAPNVQNIDLFPTVLDFCGIEKEPWMQSSPAITLTDYILGSASNEPRPYGLSMYEAPKKFVQWNKQNVNPAYIRNLLSIWDGQHKVIFSEDDKVELYDIIKDPTEQVDIINDNQEKAQELKNKFFEIINRYGGLTPDYQASSAFSAEEEKMIEERLRSLGYIE